MLGPASSAQTAIDLSITDRMALRARAVVPLRSMAVAGAVIAVLALPTVALVGVRAATSGSPRVARLGGSSRVEASRDGASLARARQQAQARQAARQRWLGSPGARAQRAASQMAFHGLPAYAAQRLLVHDDGTALAEVSANPAATVAGLGHVVRYLSDYRVLVRTSHGLQVERSTVPLRVADGAGGKQPVDLRLVEHGRRFEPVRPLTGVSIGQDSSGGVAVGSGGVRITMQGANVVGSPIGSHSVFFPGVGRDMDAVIAPKLGGAELFAVLRSRLSPQQIRYRVGLPAGAVLQAVGGGAVISRAGVTLARVPAPTARDAQGSAVPVRMGVAGDELVLSIPHRGLSIAYPVLVDPEVINITESLSGWKFSQTIRGCGPSVKFSDSGPPLTVTSPEVSFPLSKEPRCEEPRRNTELANGGWEWESPGTTYARVEFYGISSSSRQISEGHEEKEAVLWTVNACGAGAAAYESPSRVEVLPRTSSSEECHDEDDIDLGFIEGEVQAKQKPVTVSASISVEAILLSEAIKAVPQPETFVPNNPGEPNRPTCSLGRPVNCATGDQFVTQSDLSVGGRGPGLSLTRTYNSQLAVTQGEHSERGPFWVWLDWPIQRSPYFWCR